MKKVFLFALIALTSITFTACTKDHVKVPNTETAIPDELVGKWQLGNFNIAAFSSFNGTRPANMTNTLAYSISKNGSAEEWIVYDANDGNDLLTLTYRKGTVTYDATTGTWKFCPASGTWRKFQKGKTTSGDINSDGLYPKYAPSYSNYTIEKNNQTIYMDCTNAFNEDLSFQKVNW